MHTIYIYHVYIYAILIYIYIFIAMKHGHVGLASSRYRSIGLSKPGSSLYLWFILPRKQIRSLAISWRTLYIIYIRFKTMALSRTNHRPQIPNEYPPSRYPCVPMFPDINGINPKWSFLIPSPTFSSKVSIEVSSQVFSMIILRMSIVHKDVSRCSSNHMSHGLYFWLIPIWTGFPSTQQSEFQCSLYSKPQKSSEGKSYSNTRSTLDG